MSCPARMADFLDELAERLCVQNAPDCSFDMPLSQVQMGQMLGMSAVHVNRVLQDLRRRHVIEIVGRRWTILDRASLQAVAIPKGI